MNPTNLLQNTAFMNASSSVVSSLGNILKSSITDGDSTLHSAEESRNDKKNIGIATSTVTTILTILQAVMSFV